MDDELTEDLKKAINSLKQNIDGFEVRKSQQEMLKEVEDTVSSGGFKVIKAGTGTGKSFGYLIPAILATLNGKKVLVVTSTKTLQQQLCEKDLPILQKALGVDFSYSLLKGRTNYVCVQKVKEIKNDFEKKQQSFQEYEKNEALLALLNWADKTSSGDKVQAPKELFFNDYLWSQLSTDALECPKKGACPSGNECFFEKARANADSSSIVVLNSYIFATDLDHSKGIVPEYDILIIDEAHSFEDAIRSTAAVELSSYKLKQLVNLLNKVDLVDDTKSGLVNSLRRNINLIESTFESKFKDVHTDDTQLEINLNDDPDLNLIFEALELVFNDIKDAIFSQGSQQMFDMSQDARHKRLITYLEYLQEELNSFLNQNEAKQVCWLEKTGSGYVLKLSEIDISNYLKENLWDKIKEKNRSVILASATVFNWSISRLGLPEETKYLDLGNPFESEKNAIVFCPKNLPATSDETYLNKKAELIKELIKLAGGRTLVLCSSIKETKRLGELLSEAFSKENIDVLVQNTKQNEVLLEQFKKDETSVLVGSYVFFQGVDVPGKSLSMVVIDKLPFSYPDALVRARKKLVEQNNGNGFLEIDVRDTQVRLAQAAGRLIRRSDDKGVIAVLDSRLINAGYSGHLLSVFENMKIVNTLEEVQAFFKEVVNI